MSAHPDQLTDILQTLPQSIHIGNGDHNVGAVSAFVRICDELLPCLSPAKVRANYPSWLVGVEQARAWVSECVNIGKPYLPLDRTPLENLANIAKDAWIAQTRGPLREFPFMRDDALRRIAERNFVLMTDAVVRRAEHAALVYAGATLEALLDDALGPRQAHLEADGFAVLPPPLQKKLLNKGRRTPVARWDLQDKVLAASAIGLLSPRAKTVADQSRLWRNLIHPYQELAEVEESGPLSMGQAITASGFVEQVIEELSGRLSQPMS